MNFKITAISLLALISFNVMARHLAETEGTGGDPLAQDFTKASREAIAQIKEFVGKELTQADYESLEESLSTTRVYSSDLPLCKDSNCSEGISFTAMNFPSKKTIQINSKKWSELSWNQKLIIAAHEHMGIVGLERDNYDLSTKMFSSKKSVGFEDNRFISDVYDRGYMLEFTPKNPRGILLKANFFTHVISRYCVIETRKKFYRQDSILKKGTPIKLESWISRETGFARKNYFTTKSSTSIEYLKLNNVGDLTLKDLKKTCDNLEFTIIPNTSLQEIN